MLRTSTPAAGRTRRLNRIFADDGRSLIVGFDHTVSVGTGGGALRDLARVAQACEAGGVDALQMGLHSLRALDAVPGALRSPGLVLRIDQSNVNDDPAQPTPTSIAWARPDQALQAAADTTVVFYIHDDRAPGITASRAEMVGEVAREAAALGLPLMVEVMVKTAATSPQEVSSTMVDASRIAFELGADLLKIDRTPSPEAMHDLVAAVPVPVLLRGGPPQEQLTDTLRELERCLAAGVSGAVYGRTVWQNDDPERVTRALRGVMHGH